LNEVGVGGEGGNCTVDWCEEYKRKLVPADEAAKVVKSGDRVFFTVGRQAQAIGLALAARKEELKGVSIFIPTPDRDFGWYEPGWEDSFNVVIGFGMPIVWTMMSERRCDMATACARWPTVEEMKGTIDVLITEVSPPDEHGFCSFGQSLWNKKEQVQAAKVVIAEVNERLIRTYGTNFVSISEIDYFVKHIPSERLPGRADLRGKQTTGTREEVKHIAEYVSTLIKDGDTVEIGVGTSTEPLPQLGIFDNKHELGWHSEHTPGRVVELVRQGIFTGRSKTINQGKVVASAFGGSRENLAFINMNPAFELHSVNYVNDVRVIGAHDNLVAINNALAVDLSGQITSESIGSTRLGGTGGQLSFAIGASLSRGGRCITILPSTAKNGTLSRVVSRLEPGAVVNIPETFTDIVITEYGIANLRGKTLRGRVQELIAVAHPDFRAELKKEAMKLYWP
jgi:4-hydroxybutyrate CoA-transferase